MPNRSPWPPSPQLSVAPASVCRPVSCAPLPPRTFRRVKPVAATTTTPSNPAASHLFRINPPPGSEERTFLIDNRQLCPNPCVKEGFLRDDWSTCSAGEAGAASEQTQTQPSGRLSLAMSPSAFPLLPLHPPRGGPIPRAHTRFSSANASCCSSDGGSLSPGGTNCRQSVEAGA